MMAVGWLLGACTADDDAMQGGRDVPIRLGIALTEPSDTNVRATTRTASSYQNTELIAGAPVDVYIKDVGTSTMIANPVECTVSGNSGDLTYDGYLYYPASGADVSIYAIHPRVASGSAFAVSADQTSDANYAASDLIYSKPASYAYSNSTQTLTMAHLMSQIVVNISLPSAWAGRAITNLKLHAKRTATVTYPVENGNGYTLGEASGSVEAISISEGGAAVIPPQSITSGSTFITFQVAGVGPYTYALPANTTFAPGHRYVYTITPKSGTLSYNETSFSRLMHLGKFTNPLTHIGNAPVIYTSSNTSVATVDPATGVVTPVKTGYTTITATVPDGLSNGYSITSASYNLSIRGKEMIPLWYVALYNMNNSATMATSNDAGHFYSWSKAMSYFAAQTTSYSNYRTANKNIGGVNYHLPVSGEWLSIFPANNVQSQNLVSYVPNVNDKLYKPNVATVIFGFNATTKAGISESSYFVRASATEIHAIRFLGTDYCSAWKYQWNGGWTNESPGYVLVYATLIDKVANSGSTAASWYTNNWSSITFDNSESNGRVQRTFYSRGYTYNPADGYATTATHLIGEQVGYTSATKDGDLMLGMLIESTSSARVGLYRLDAIIGRTIRLFRDN